MRASLVMRRLLRALMFLAAITTCFGASRAVAGPPYVTDDPEPVDHRHWEINTAVTYANSGSGEVSGNLPLAEFNYGIVPNAQITLDLPMAYDYTADSHKYAYGATGLGAKYRFVQESSHMPEIAFAPSVQFPVNAGDHAVTFLPLWAQKNFGSWSVFGGGGVYINTGPGNRDFTYLGAVLTHDVSPATTLGVELFHQSADTIDGSDTTGANLGMVSQIGEHHAILLSLGRALHGSNSFMGYLAYRFMLGPEEAKK